MGNTVGIIVEYNPLHNGHVYHFQASKQASAAEATIAVMSGHFLQRGEPAIVNKWARTEMALHMGADLIIELPSRYAVQPAEWFAYGAVSALEATGIVDSLCFGSESGEISWFQRWARRLLEEPAAFRTSLKSHLKEGLNYPAAYAAAMEQYPAAALGADRDEASAITRPNNILGLHYVLALERLASTIQPLTISRRHAEYDQFTITDNAIASATALRKQVAEGAGWEALRPYVPSQTLTLLQREADCGRAPIGWECFARPLFHQLLTAPPGWLAGLNEMSEGLENRIMDQLTQLPASAGVNVLLERIKTKRYTRTKLQRTLFNVLINRGREACQRERMQAGVSYLRVLGFSQKGRCLLKQMKKTASVPVILKANRENASLLEEDLRCSAAYAAGYTSSGAADWFEDYYRPPVVLE